MNLISPLPLFLSILSLFTLTHAIPQPSPGEYCPWTPVYLHDNYAANTANTKSVRTLLNRWEGWARAKDGDGWRPSVPTSSPPNRCAEDAFVRDDRMNVAFYMCTGDHGGGERGIKWEVDEVVTAVNKMLATCAEKGVDRVRGKVGLGGTRGYVFVDRACLKNCPGYNASD